MGSVAELAGGHFSLVESSAVDRALEPAASGALRRHERVLTAPREARRQRSDELGALACAGNHPFAKSGGSVAVQARGSHS